MFGIKTLTVLCALVCFLFKTQELCAQETIYGQVSGWVTDFYQTLDTFPVESYQGEIPEIPGGPEIPTGFSIGDRIDLSFSYNSLATADRASDRNAEYFSNIELNVEASVNNLVWQTSTIQASGFSGINTTNSLIDSLSFFAGSYNGGSDLSTPSGRSDPGQIFFNLADREGEGGFLSSLALPVSCSDVALSEVTRASGEITTAISNNDLVELGFFEAGYQIQFDLSPETFSIQADLESPRVGSPKSLGQLEQVFVGNNLAEQGIAWTGDEWVTARGQTAVLGFHEPRSLARVQGDCATPIVVDEDQSLVSHIGDVAFSNNKVFAPLEVIDFSNPGAVGQQIGRYDSATLQQEMTWDVPGNIRFAGLESHDGKLLGIEHVTESQLSAHGFARLIQLDGSSPDSFLNTAFLNVGLANGVAVNGDRVFVTSGDIFGTAEDGSNVFRSGRIHVFLLDDILAFDGSVLDAELHGLGTYEYEVPRFLHAQGITFKGDELWVSRGDYLTRLDYENSIASSRSVASDMNGNWSVAMLGSLPDSMTSVTMQGSSLSISDEVVARNIYIDLDSNLSLSTAGVLDVSGTVGVRDGQLHLSGAGATISELEIGGGSGSGTLEIDRSAEFEISKRLTLFENGRVDIDEFVSIFMTGSDFQNFSTSPQEFEDLVNLKLVFEGGDEVVDLFEVGGVDVGETDFVPGNFALGELHVGGRDDSVLRLVDFFDNQLDYDGLEALYLHDLQVLPGSVFDLNGVNVYVNGVRVSNGQGAIYGGGTIINAVPEPSSTFFFYMFSVFVVSRRSRIPITSKA